MNKKAKALLILIIKCCVLCFKIMCFMMLWNQEVVTELPKVWSSLPHTHRYDLAVCDMNMFYFLLWMTTSPWTVGHIPNDAPPSSAVVPKTQPPNKVVRVVLKESMCVWGVEPYVTVHPAAFSGHTLELPVFILLLEGTYVFTCFRLRSI